MDYIYKKGVLIALIYLWYGIGFVSSIDCFECHSLDGSHEDCEDQFGTPNETAHLVRRTCRVGYLQFKANYCIKIKGVKESGEHVLVRTCSMNDWGTTCGDLRIEQPDRPERIVGCIASCNYDGCNKASSINSIQSSAVHYLIIFMMTVEAWLSITRSI